MVFDSEQSIVLVTPVWNDSSRLSVFGPKLAEAIRASGLPVRWIVADDGSDAEEKSRVGEVVASLRMIYPRVEAMLFDQRAHKGGAIYSAWDLCPEATWLGFVDSDGAIDAASTIGLIQTALAAGPKSGCVGVRHHSKETPLQRPLGRLISFYIFTFLVRGLVGIRFRDTQCGAKIIPAEGYRKVSAKLEERGFIFDVELLLALDLSGYSIREQPIPWREMPGGKVRPLRDAWAMLAGMLRIRRRSRTGHYLS